MLTKPDINRPVFQVHPAMRDRVLNMLCTICGNEIIEDEFTDEQSKKEYSITGMCQRCQDDFFGKE